MGIGLSAMLALMLLPLAMLSHPAHGVALPVAAQTQPDNLFPRAVAQDEPVNAHGNADVHNAAAPRAQQLSRAQVVALVQHRYRARVVRTHLLQDANGRALYEFRLLSSAGKVWTVRIDAYSGAELP
jgi:uncharacterized membrane protein YkoI